jgi:hypothetical protein
MDGGPTLRGGHFSLQGRVVFFTTLLCREKGRTTLQGALDGISFFRSVKPLMWWVFYYLDMDFKHNHLYKLLKCL